MDRKNSENGVRIHTKNKRRKQSKRTKEQMIQERLDKTKKQWIFSTLECQ